VAPELVDRVHVLLRRDKREISMCGIGVIISLYLFNVL
jgi:hypothetical protein